MADPKLIRAEKEYLLSMARQLPQRIKDFNQNVDSAERLPALKFSSWKLENLASKETSGGSETKPGGNFSNRPRLHLSPLRNLSPKTSQGAQLINLTQGVKIRHPAATIPGENRNREQNPLASMAVTAVTANEQGSGQQGAAESEPETQFESMRKRNPTWAQVTDQNTQKTGPICEVCRHPICGGL
ncbi:hypothetical protein R1sor_008929 [Riccia sorocarpa]|uniref:Uncharacterized protein n=1 Tax=Riccia sorocarpa TaxID=122646 RepID=A0ABD3H4D0_9MARC